MHTFPEPDWQTDDGRVMLYNGDCRDILPTLPPASCDACVTDPPYGIGFIGTQWDTTDISFQSATWAACLRPLRPGGHCLAFSAPRTYHRIAGAVEDGGFELRDQLIWLYANGFTKSLNVGKAIDKHLGASRTVVGSKGYTTLRGHFRGTPWGGLGMDRVEVMETEPATEQARRWEGWGTTLKPAHEPIVMARRPLEAKTAVNIMRHGTGGLNIDGCRIPAPDRAAGTGGNAGDRCPSNVLHDGSDVILDELGDVARFFYCAKSNRSDSGFNNTHPTVKPDPLMRYLVRLVTPPSGIVIDPFMGSGSTGVACVRQGFRFIGIECDPGYFTLAVARLTSSLACPLFDGRN